MNKNLLYKGLTIPPPMPEPEPEPDPTPVEDDYHFSANITVGTANMYIENNGYAYDYGFSTQDGASLMGVFGSSSSSRITSLFGQEQTYNSLKTTHFSIVRDNSIYQNKTLKITRLDTGQVVSTRYVYNEVEGAPEKSNWFWEQINSMLFTSADVGKTITVQFEIS